MVTEWVPKQYTAAAHLVKVELDLSTGFEINPPCLRGRGLVPTRIQPPRSISQIAAHDRSLAAIPVHPELTAMDLESQVSVLFLLCK